MSTPPTAAPSTASVSNQALLGDAALAAALATGPRRRTAAARASRIDYMRPVLSPGVPLDPPLRARMEDRLGTSLAAARVHDDGDAAAAADAIGAAAFTVGRHVVLGRDAMNRTGTGHGGGVTGDELLAHELSHAVQQGLSQPPAAGSDLPWTHPGDRVEREAASGRRPVPGTEPLAIAAKWSGDADAIWKRFDSARSAGKQADALAAAKELISKADGSGSGQFDGWANEGVDLAIWLLDNGNAALAQSVLNRVERTWVLKAVSAPAKAGAPATQVPLPPDIGLLGVDGPTKLIDRGKQAVKADDHELAFRLFGLAFQFMQMQLEGYRERREQELAKSLPQSGAVESMVRGSFVYPRVQEIYGRMREVLGFYEASAREARAAGDPDRARQLSGWSLFLADELKSKYTWGGEAITSEFTPVDTPRGPALRIHGANSETTDVTQLAGLPSPKEVKGRVQWESTERIRESLTRQVEFIDELKQDPQIVREFGTATIDMNDPAQRLRVWAAMLRSYQASGAQFTTPLYSLLSLIGRYLKGFTRHTEYNIRDFGTNYLSSTFPTDLADRAVRDCGVYALTTAWEVFRTARAATPRLNISFELIFSPDHVVLVIEDKDNQQTYVASNDQIVPVTGDMGQVVAKQFATQPGRGSVSFGRRVALGSTKDTVADFQKNAWDTYVKQGISIKPEAKTGPTDTRSEAERYEAAATTYYETQRLYDEGQATLRVEIADFEKQLATGDAQKLLQTGLPPLTTKARALAGLFLLIMNYGRGIPGGITIWHSIEKPPIVRTALLLLRVAEAGGTLSADDIELVRFAAAAFNATDVRNNPFFPSTP